MPLPVDHRSHSTEPRQTIVKQGARRLMAAVLENALAALEHDPNDAEVWGWIDIRGSAYLYSFDSICEALHLDPSAARQALHRWQITTRRRAPYCRGRVTLRYLIVRRQVNDGVADTG